MDKFFDDFEIGKQNRRYLFQELPELDFKSHQFDLCLCSHFLFLYSDQLPLKFHLDSINEMLRISREVRIFPLLQLDGKTSVHLNQVLDFFSNDKFDLQLENVDYEFQRNGNKMMRIRPGGSN